jgi:hypothetical protein
MTVIAVVLSRSVTGSGLAARRLPTWSDRLPPACRTGGVAVCHQADTDVVYWPTRGSLPTCGGGELAASARSMACERESRPSFW